MVSKSKLGSYVESVDQSKTLAYFALVLVCALYVTTDAADAGINGGNVIKGKQ